MSVNTYVGAGLILTGAVLLAYGTILQAGCLASGILFVGLGILLVGLGAGFLRFVRVAAFLTTIGVAVAIYGYLVAPIGHC